MSGKTTQLVVNEVRPGVRSWSWGHLRAERKGDSVRLVVATDTDDSYTTPRLLPAQALAAGDALRAAAGNAPKTMCGGKSLHQMMWEELMSVVERIMTGQEAADGRDPGRAEGIAYTIALFANPYAPNIEAVRDEAMERWEAEESD